jgi:hypothetical protein
MCKIQCLLYTSNKESGNEIQCNPYQNPNFFAEVDKLIIKIHLEIQFRISTMALHITQCQDVEQNDSNQI